MKNNVLGVGFTRLRKTPSLRSGFLAEWVSDEETEDTIGVSPWSFTRELTQADYRCQFTTFPQFQQSIQFLFVK